MFVRRASIIPRPAGTAGDQSRPGEYLAKGRSTTAMHPSSCRLTPCTTYPRSSISSVPGLQQSRNLVHLGHHSAIPGNTSMLHDTATPMTRSRPFFIATVPRLLPSVTRFPNGRRPCFPCSYSILRMAVVLGTPRQMCCCCCCLTPVFRYQTLKDQRRGQNPPTDRFLRDPRRAYLRFVQILVRPSSVSKREAFRKVLHWGRPRSLASCIFSNLFTVEDSYPWSQVMEELPGPARVPLSVASSVHCNIMTTTSPE
jgi:hypothetical protein